MERRLTDLAFEPWLDFMFGRAVRWDFYPYFDERDEFWDPDPTTGVDYLTRLFEDPVPLLRPYDDRQIGSALWLLPGEDAHFIHNREVPLEARERFIDSITSLFASLFEPRCAPVLGHLDQPGSGPLNPACYMWWENLPFVASGDDPDRMRLESRMLDVMEATLALANPACQEAALHGLGHTARHAPDRVTRIIGAYFTRDGLAPELSTYARAACTGCIL